MQIVILRLDTKTKRTTFRTTHRIWQL